eukprot:Hpha_TRINITY_DN16193_c1_g2::TRINITY_DN16193_c1_g2_i1::g.3658::m.3658
MVAAARPDLEGVLARVWSRTAAGQKAYGPVALARESMKLAGWTWKHTHVIELNAESRVNLRTVREQDWAHTVRDALRRSQWRALSARRPRQFAGLEDGIDRLTTLALYKGASRTDQGFLRVATTSRGSVISRD